MQTTNTTNTDTTWIIKDISFTLAVNRKPVCPKRFALNYGCSYHKLKQAVLNNNNNNTKPPKPKPIQTSISLQQNIYLLLSDFFHLSTTAATINNQPVQYLHGYHTHKQLYEDFIKAEIKVGGSVLVPSENTFLSVWQKRFPFVWLAGETLCSTCYKLQTQITASAVGSYGMSSTAPSTSSFLLPYPYCLISLYSSIY